MIKKILEHVFFYDNLRHLKQRIELWKWEYNQSIILPCLGKQNVI